ncbi:MAG: Extracellular solute-binding protein [Deltaproteobacteria bacterium]|nr:Extracellular solute-binding protein [Deltaproteobacteria bacterium]
MIRRKTSAPLFFLLFALCRAADLPAAEDRTVELAKKEGRLSFYTSMAAEESKLLADAFQSKYPFLRVEISRLSSEKLLQRIITEQRTGSNLFDVVTNSGMEVYLLAKMGLLARYVSPEAQAFFADSRDPAGRWVDMYSNLRVIAYNTRSVTKEKIPQRYEDLLNPAWKGRIGFPEGQVAWYVTMLRVMGEENGRKFFQGLARQDLQYRAAPVLIAQFVAAGEFNLGFVYENQVLRIKKRGAPIDVAPLPFVTKNMHPLALSAAAPHANAGKLFIDYVLSKEGQLFIKNLGRVISRADIPQEEFARFKMVPEDAAIADRINQVTEDYKKYLQ